MYNKSLAFFCQIWKEMKVVTLDLTMAKNSNEKIGLERLKVLQLAG